MKDKLKLNYSDWWDNGRDFVFTQIISQRYDIDFTSPENSDIVFTSAFGSSRDHIDNFKIYYTGENTRNPINVDYKLSYNPDSHFRLPIYYVMSNEYTFITKKKSPLMLENRVGGSRDKFCGFLISNPSNHIRNNTFMTVSDNYKHVESGGGVFNNIGYRVGPNTIEWMSQYKFFICFENSKYDYYITEKLINAYHAGCIPIYWGSDTVSEELNENCMINFNKMSSHDELIDKIREIDNDENLYKRMLQEPLLKDNKFDINYSSDSLLEKFTEIINMSRK